MSDTIQTICWFVKM